MAYFVLSVLSYQILYWFLLFNFIGAKWFTWLLITKISVWRFVYFYCFLCCSSKTSFWEWQNESELMFCITLIILPIIVTLFDNNDLWNSIQIFMEQNVSKNYIHYSVGLHIRHSPCKCFLAITKGNRKILLHIQSSKVKHVINYLSG